MSRAMLGSASTPALATPGLGSLTTLTPQAGPVPSVPMRPLHWVRLPPAKLAHTIWDTTEGGPPVEGGASPRTPTSGGATSDGAGAPLPAAAKERRSRNGFFGLGAWVRKARETVEARPGQVVVESGAHSDSDSDADADGVGAHDGGAVQPLNLEEIETLFGLQARPRATHRRPCPSCPRVTPRASGPARLARPLVFSVAHHSPSTSLAPIPCRRPAFDARARAAAEGRR